jgi:hypothetical protein
MLTYFNTVCYYIVYINCKNSLGDSMKTKISIIIYLCIIVVAGYFASADNNDDLVPNGMTGEELLTRFYQAIPDTYQFKLNAEVSIMNESSIAEMAGTIDELNRELSLHSEAEENSSAYFNIYVVDNWIYTTMNDTNSNKAWIKTTLTDDLWKQYAMPSQQLQLFKNPLDVEYVGTEMVAEGECYKLAVNPSLTTLSEIYGIGDSSNMSELEDLFKAYSLNLWISQQTYLPVRILTDVNISFPYYTLEISMGLIYEITFSNYNEPVNIELPAAATNAIEISYEDFMAGEW